MSVEKRLENIENHYLEKFYHFLKYCEDEMLAGFETKEKIKGDWIKKWNPDDETKGKGISSFATGAERIVYALFNGKGIGQPNSAPIGSDLFFETEKAFIHIDLKTVQTRNMSDYCTSIFVGDNQNSYIEKIVITRGKNKGERRDYKGALPKFYNNNRDTRKPCLTYFITILYDEKNLRILNINLLCMPNGYLSKLYRSDVLQAGKNPGKTRFRFSKTSEFKLLSGKKRIKVIYFDDKMNQAWAKKLKFIKSIYDSQ